MQLTSRPPLATPPFRLQAEPAEAYAHPSWQAAREGALAALRRGASVAVLGRGGTGKTLLLQSLAESLRAEGIAVARFGAESGGTEIVLADEAGSLDAEGLRRLCALGPRFAAAGLPEVEARVRGCGRPIEVVRLESLTPEEVARYVVGRLAATGRARDLFEPDAILALARWSGGLFRLVVALAGSAMFLAQQEVAGRAGGVAAGETRVTRRHVDEAAAMREGLQEAPAPPPDPVPAAPVPQLAASRAAAPVAAPRRFRVAPLVGALAGVAGLGLAVLAGAWALSYGHRSPPAPRVAAGPATVAPAPSPPQPAPAPSPVPAGAPVQAAPRPVPQGRAQAVDASAPMAFRGPINNETIGQGGQLSLTIRAESGPGPVVAHFHAYAGLIGTGDLAGTLGADGRVSLSGQLMMGRNPFDCTLTGVMNGGVLTGSATFVRVGSGSTTRSTFALSRL